MNPTVTPVTSPTLPAAAARPQPGLLELALLAIALLVMYAPMYMSLTDQLWSQDGQGHGPVMLVLTIYLAWKRWPALAALPTQSNPVAATLLFVFALVFYILGQSQDFPEFAAGSQIPLLMALLLYFRGWAGVRLMWFPLFFIFFLVPLPQIVVMMVTAPLKAGVSYVAEAIMYHVGYPIGRTGVTLTIGQYKLLVADACAGLNSIFALEA